MTTIESLKDIPTIASISALIALGVFVPYTLSEFSKIKSEQEEIKKHLAALIATVDPNGKKQMEQVVKAVQILDGRLVKTQGDLEAISKQSAAITHTKREQTLSYKRLTERTPAPTPSQEAETAALEYEEGEPMDDMKDDLEAMKG